MSTSLVVLEVSQKQAFIFSSNKLKKNICNSAYIAYVTSEEFFKVAAKEEFDKGNIVYTGGGHTVLEFAEEGDAKKFVSVITECVIRNIPEMELFAKVYTVEGEPNIDSLKTLMEALEEKKSIRKATFVQGTFGVERLDVNTGRAIIVGNSKDNRLPDTEEKIDSELFPDGFTKAWNFGDLCGSDDNKNFLAVIHIDGNAMGKRVIEYRQSIAEKSWNYAKEKMNKFSENIDHDFKSAFKEMEDIIAKQIELGYLNDLKLKKDEKGNSFFPIRRIITAGDDICFVTNGKIGLECARIFLEKLSGKVNETDNKGYSACAGVALVHQKYPFYKAYELAEQLCSNAKSYIATTAGTEASAFCSGIDWHVEYGEVPDTLDGLKEEYIADDGSIMTLKPYVVVKDEKFPQSEKFRDYNNFRTLISRLQNKDIDFARGKLKQLRDAIRKGENATEVYLSANLMNDLKLVGFQNIFQEMDFTKAFENGGLEKTAYVKIGENRHSIFFDAIEIMDVFIPVDEKEET